MNDLLRKSSDVVADFSVCLKTPKGPGGSGGGGRSDWILARPFSGVSGDLDPQGSGDRWSKNVDFPTFLAIFVGWPRTF